MDAPAETPGQPNIEMYTRNGFAGPMSIIVRGQYTPPYTRVRGSYAPYRLDVSGVSDEQFADDQAMSYPILEGDGVSIEVAHRTKGTPVAFRNVLADELHYVLEGGARLDTDFGFLELKAGDFVLLPRGVTYRYASVAESLREIILTTSNQLILDPDFDTAVLDMEKNVDAPTPDPSSDRGPGEYEVVVRHGAEFTSYFYDYDPMPCLATDGEPAVRRFNFSDVHALSGAEAGPIPAKLIVDPTTNTLVFNLSGRENDRPPVHHNADYDEIIFYVAGPGHYGAVDRPGTITWTPKGIIHHGPVEDVPEGYKAWLVETRSTMTLTPAGRELATLMETGEFAIHPSVTA